MTGTIIPNITEVLFVSSPEERKKQYIDAIKFYLVNTNFDIVFTENSGTSLAKYFQGETRLEFVTFISPVSLPDKGKSFKELEILDYSINNSCFIAEAASIIKITGRLKILNINQISKSVENQDLGDKKLIISNIYKKLKMDSRCFLFTPDFLPVLRRKGEDITMPYSFERVLWKAANEYVQVQGGEYKQFGQPLRIEGVNGGYGTVYKHGTLHSLAKKVRHTCMPWIYYKYFKK